MKLRLTQPCCLILVAFTTQFFGAANGFAQSSDSRIDESLNNYDFYSLSATTEESLFALRPVSRQDLGLHTSDELAVMSQDPASYFLGLLEQVGAYAGIVMVKKRQVNDSSDNYEPSEVTVIVTGFGPFKGVPVNPSSEVAREVDRQLDKLGIDSEVRIIDVNWGDPETAIDDAIKDVKKREPDHRIVVISIGVNPNGKKYTFETVGRNDRMPIADNVGGIPGVTPGTPPQNDPNGDATVGHDYDVTMQMDSQTASMLAKDLQLNARMMLADIFATQRHTNCTC
jgi:hypothetical protein